MNAAEKDRRYRDYLTSRINPIIEPLISQLLKNQPEDIHEFIIDFIRKHKADPNSVAPTRFGSSFKSSSTTTPKPTEQQYTPQPVAQKTTTNKPAPAPETPPDSEEGSDEEEVEEVPIEELQKLRGRTSVSAEAYGKFNQKGDFKPRVIKKTADQRQRIVDRLTKAFMFATLDPREQQIIIDAMEEKKYKAGDWVIKQGDDGDNLYVIDSGTLECYKQFEKHSEPKHVKTYNPGESFGELALLYNAPRAASIKAVTESVLFALDRDTFNNIVKESIKKRREKFETILAKIELLDTMDPYERSKIADVAIPIKFKAGEFVIKQGEQGDRFYFIEEGTAVATKTMAGRKEPEVVYNYGAGDYFGELALLRGEARAANVMAKSDLSLLALDRVAFDRILGPLQDLLKRNTNRYDKFM